MCNDLYIQFLEDNDNINKYKHIENRCNSIIIKTRFVDDFMLLDAHHIFILNNIISSNNFDYTIDFDKDMINTIYIDIKGESEKTIIANEDELFNNQNTCTDLLEKTYLSLKNKLLITLINEINIINFINYFQSFLVDGIINLPKDIMFSYIRDKYYNRNRRLYDKEVLTLDKEPELNFHKFNVYELLGCYIHTNGYNDNRELNDILEKYKLNNDKKVILICKQKIDDVKDDFKKSSLLDNMLADNLFNMVFVHEMGHYTFDYNTTYFVKKPLVTSSFKEKQANYFLSHLYAGYLDKLIDRLTSIQSSIYHNPILYSKECSSLINIGKSNAYNLYTYNEGKLICGH